MFFTWLRNRRRRQLLAQPFPEEWLQVLERNVVHYSYLEPSQQARVRNDLRVFVAEKNWEGCGGLEMTDEIKVTVAAHVCLMLLGIEHDYFAQVLSILVYPAAFQVPQRRQVGNLELDDASDRLGEAWYRGPVILAWKEVRREGRHPHSGRNLVWHEFAHQLDMLDRSTDGTPPLKSADERRRWQAVMTPHFEQLVDDATAGRPTLLDPYGATSEAEFFAVVTECFFDLPGLLREEHPDLYALLADYYGQDPAMRVPVEVY
jgi:Mlc titration factor MtfA (ptsG expression regulator)